MKTLAILFMLLLPLSVMAADADISVGGGVLLTQNDGVFCADVKVGIPAIYNETAYIYSDFFGTEYSIISSYQQYEVNLFPAWSIGFGTGIWNIIEEGTDDRLLAYKLFSGYEIKDVLKVSAFGHFLPENEDMWYLGIGITWLK